MSFIEATYRLRCTAPEAEPLAVAIAWEQTVELPAAVVPEPVARAVVGRVVSVKADPTSSAHFLAVIEYAEGLASGALSPLLNLIFGNVSLFGNARLVDLALPIALQRSLGGPTLGVRGLRRQTGVSGRPLLATAIKPRGADIQTLSELARGFAAGGGDLIKDDQNLTDPSFEAFASRIGTLAAAVADGNEQGGGNCLYWPHVTGPDIERKLDMVQARGLTGVLMAPMIVGPEVTSRAVRDRGLGLMAHPALAGSFTQAQDHGIDHGVLLGKLFRLLGSDISVFPNAGGRFSFSVDECGSIARALRAPMEGVAPAWPAPAGGMTYDSLPSLIQDYGPDTVLLVGGALQAHGERMIDSTREFRARIEQEV